MHPPGPPARLGDAFLLSIVVPVYNEEATLPELWRRLAAAIESCTTVRRVEFVFVDDGSRDASVAFLRTLAERDERVRYLSFSRNFGHQIALTAGLDHARGDAIVTIDADLQDPPELIPRLVGAWRAGADVAYAQRRTRRGDQAWKRLAAAVFYRGLQAITDTRPPREAADFRLIDHRVAEVLRACRETPRYVRGLVAWAGFKQVGVPYDRDARFAGVSNYSLSKLVRLALSGIVGFSSTPLTWPIWAGAFLFLLALGVNTALAIAALTGASPSTYVPWMVGAMLVLASLQLLALGILGGYVAMVHRASLRRPMYIIAERGGFEVDVVGPVQPGTIKEMKREHGKTAVGTR